MDTDRWPLHENCFFVVCKISPISLVLRLTQEIGFRGG